MNHIVQKLFIGCLLLLPATGHGTLPQPTQARERHIIHRRNAVTLAMLAEEIAPFIVVQTPENNTLLLGTIINSRRSSNASDVADDINSDTRRTSIASVSSNLSR